MFNQLEQSKQALAMKEETANGNQELLEKIEHKDKSIADLKNEVADLTKKVNSQEAEREKTAEFEKTIAQLEKENCTKSDQIEKLHLRYITLFFTSTHNCFRVNDMLEQVGNIKEELVKKNEEIKQITAKTTQLQETNIAQAATSETKLDTVNEEHKEKLKKYEETIQKKEKEVCTKTERIEELETCLKEREVELNDMRSKLDELVR